MAHKKAGSSKARQGGNVAGKRLGIKISGGEVIKTGQIVLRQRGAVYRSGEGTGIGKDFTIFAKRDGVVSFKQISKDKKQVRIF